MEIKIDEPSSISKKRMTCCQVFSWDRFTVLRPACVMADTHKKRLSVKVTLNAGVDEPHMMMAVAMHTTM